MAAASLQALQAVAEKLADRLMLIQRRLDALESTNSGKGIHWRGRWCADVDYTGGDMVTHGAGVWIADNATRSMPGATAAWQRMLRADKRGFHDGGSDE